MNEFELFTMIFYAVDLYYDSNPSDDLGAFLGMMSPFTFKEVDSADPAIFSDFCNCINGRQITIDNSLKYAIDYAKTVKYCDIAVAFNGITTEQWKAACEDYLEKQHKGMT